MEGPSKLKTTLESVPNDLGDATHKDLDKRVLTLVGEPSKERLVTLLIMVVLSSNQRLDGNLKAAETLITNHLELGNMLMDAWKSRSFRAIR